MQVWDFIDKSLTASLILYHHHSANHIVLCYEKGVKRMSVYNPCLYMHLQSKWLSTFSILLMHKETLVPSFLLIIISLSSIDTIVSFQFPLMHMHWCKPTKQTWLCNLFLAFLSNKECHTLLLKSLCNIPQNIPDLSFRDKILTWKATNKCDQFSLQLTLQDKAVQLVQMIGFYVKASPPDEIQCVIA